MNDDPGQARQRESTEIAAIMQTLRSGARLPARPMVSQIRCVLADDSMSAPSIFATVMLPADFPDSEWTARNLDPIVAAIRTAVQQAGIDRWVYVRFDREAEIQRAAG